MRWCEHGKNHPAHIQNEYNAEMKWTKTDMKSNKKNMNIEEESHNIDAKRTNVENTAFQHTLCCAHEKAITCEIAKYDCKFIGSNDKLMLY